MSTESRLSFALHSRRHLRKCGARLRTAHAIPAIWMGATEMNSIQIAKEALIQKIAEAAEMSQAGTMTREEADKAITGYVAALKMVMGE